MQSMLVLWLVASVIALTGCGGSGPDSAVPQRILLSLDEFGRTFCEKVADVDPTVTAKPSGELRVTLEYGADQEQTVQLNEAYEEYKVASENVDLILNRVVDSNLAIIRQARDAQIDTAQILPVLMNRRHLKELRTSRRAADAVSADVAVYFEPLNDELVVSYQRLDKRPPRYLLEHDVASLNVPPGTLREMAVANLHRLAPQAKTYSQYGVTGVSAGDQYESCLLLLDQLWTKELFAVDGDIVVAVPSRNALLVTGSNNEAGVAQLALVAREAFATSDYPVSDQLFVRKAGRWHLFAP
jgi:uncharacterized protein YtpQ (UPF0354 family)